MAFGTGGPHYNCSLHKIALSLTYGGANIENVLGAGCGSGILANCAVALGAKSAQDLDTKMLIVNEATENVARNGLSSKIEVHRGTIEAVNDKFDLITANVLIDLLDQMDDEFASRINPDGHVMVSGFRNEYRDDVRKRFTDLGLIMKYQLHEDEWSPLLFSKSK